MNSLLHLFVLTPLIGFGMIALIPSKKESFISRIAFLITGIQLLSAILFIIAWLIEGRKTLDIRDIVLFKSDSYEFFIDFCFDKITAVYLSVGASITFLIASYSRSYLHRENGYKRFFTAILFFYCGYNITIFSGNLETLFIGWEILGISSFLLIAFYRERFLPVKNAMKVFFVYRIGDIGLILAMWMSHNLFHENTTFLKLKNYEMVHSAFQNHSSIGIFISLMILLAAAAKSAQLPFSSWLPRAMEGPTPSSAIFYGSMSVHIGVFILLRTYPFWEYQTSVRIIIIALGLFTSLLATGMARVQSAIKSQIAYSSIAQIGLIFAELGAGFENLALIHFAGNAFLRTYQLLVSPSVVSYLIREQFYYFTPRKNTFEDFLPKKLANTIYVLCMKEWGLDRLLNHLSWKPFKKLGEKLNILSPVYIAGIFVPIYLAGTFALYHEQSLPAKLIHYLPSFFCLLGLLMVVKSFTERKSISLSWLLIIANHFCIALAVSFNEHFKNNQTMLYLSGVIIAGFVGYFCIQRLKMNHPTATLDDHQGYSAKYPWLAFVFLLSCLGLSGFPITPTFIGEDLIFSHIHEDQFVLAFLVSVSFIIDGLSLIRIYARVFLGPYVHASNEVPYRSS